VTISRYLLHGIQINYPAYFKVIAVATVIAIIAEVEWY